METITRKPRVPGTGHGGTEANRIVRHSRPRL